MSATGEKRLCARCKKRLTGKTLCQPCAAGLVNRGRETRWNGGFPPRGKRMFPTKKRSEP